MITAIERILHKLDQVRGGDLRCFGSESHQFRLNPPLTESVILQFEAKHQVRLPEDYRIFLTQAGNGGAGPYYGLLPLEKWNDAIIDEISDCLARPSPLHPDMPADTAWEKTLHCPSQELFQGTLTLVHQGCSYYALLVVTGKHRGRVVYVNLDRCGTPYFVLDAGFLSWYERWLDELLWGFDNSWFGTGLPGGEEEMVAALRRVEEPANLHVEALSTLMRIPTLHSDTLLLLRDLLRHQTAKVRCLATFLLGKHKVIEAKEEVQILARDSDPDVRKSAVECLAKMPGVNWEPIARQALQDEAEPVVFRAMCMLKDANLLQRTDIETMLKARNPIVRSNALWAADAIVEGSGQVEISDDTLFDRSKEVRRSAILVAKRDKLPSLLRLLRSETDLDILSCLLGALGRFGDVSAVAEIIEFTKHSDGFVRQDAARALGKLGDQRAIPSLRRLLDDYVIPERRQEDGLSGMKSGQSVADTAREALAIIERPGFFQGMRRFFA
jgi:hypothetical protein